MIGLDRIFALPLVDCQERHQRYPDTFWVPTLAECSEVEVGMDVKVNAEDDSDVFGERFWVTVRDKLVADNGSLSLLGAILSDNMQKHWGVDVGDIIQFEPRHICQIWPGVPHEWKEPTVH